MKPLKIIFNAALVLLLIMPVVSNAQNFMRINQKDGTTIDFPISEIRKLTFTPAVTATKEQLAMVQKAMISLKAYPNPTPGILNVDYEITSHGQVELEIYSIDGKQILKHKAGKLNPGKYLFKWSAGQYPSGQYIFRIRQNNLVASEKIIVK